MYVILDGYTLFDIEYYQKQSDRSKDWYSEIDCLPVVEGIAYFLKDSFKNSERILALCGVKDGNLLVPFAGSGTEMVAGLNFGMNVTGFEIESDYISIAQKRLEDALQKKNNSLFL